MILSIPVSRATHIWVKMLPEWATFKEESGNFIVTIDNSVNSEGMNPSRLLNEARMRFGAEQIG